MLHVTQLGVGRQDASWAKRHTCQPGWLDKQVGRHRIVGPVPTRAVCCTSLYVPRDGWQAEEFHPDRPRAGGEAVGCRIAAEVLSDLSRRSGILGGAAVGYRIRTEIHGHGSFDHSPLPLACNGGDAGQEW
jgi:hypothetical protein